MSNDPLNLFIEHWSRANLKESAAAQTHFNDLCELFDHEKPAHADPDGERFTFEMYTQKENGGTGFADVWKDGFFAWEYKGKHADLDKALEQLLRYRRNLNNPPLLVVCDLLNFEIHTNFTNAVNRTYKFTIEDLRQETHFTTLWRVFHDPEALHPDYYTDDLTRDAASRFGQAAVALEKNGEDPARVAHFLTQLVFAMFAEDIGLLPRRDNAHRGIVTDILTENRSRPDLAGEDIRQLFATMSTGGRVHRLTVPHFNGGLFHAKSADALYVPPLHVGGVMGDLVSAAQLDWKSVNPSIFGTLFERGLDPAKRAQLGAHYTSEEDILAIVEPVLMAPLRREWDDLRGKARKARSDKTRQRQRDAMLDRLREVTVLDPACGSGNFLYVSLRLLLDLEQEVLTDPLFEALKAPLPAVSPAQVRGLEINAYAQELAAIVMWIGYIQWHKHNGYDYEPRPILQPLDNVTLMDAILGQADDGTLYEPEWPAAEVIVGNPPFLGGNKIRQELGDDYVESLFDVYEEIPNFSDLCCYWFERARGQIAGGKAKRAGLLATQGIRGGVNRAVLERIKEDGDIFFAISDREWILDGANVHVSMVGFDDGSEANRSLDDENVENIHPDLTAQVNLTQANRLRENQDICFQGASPKGSFDIPGEMAQKLLAAPINPNGRPNSDVVRPYINAVDLTKRNRDYWIIDFGNDASMDEAAFYEEPFEYVRKVVYPERQKQRRERRRRLWWIFGEAAPGMRNAIHGLSRYIATPRVSKHRLFVWVDPEIIPSDSLMIFGREDDYFFGVLHSRAHELWALRQGTHLEDRPRYTPTSTFETFPFPYPPGTEDPDHPHVRAIAEAARELHEKRDLWLNPHLDPNQPEGVKVEEATLRKRTLTNLYNANPTWLQNLHAALDEAVFMAYGWPANLDDDEILRRLLALNLERAAAQEG